MDAQITLVPENAGYELRLIRQRRDITVGRIAYEIGISRSSVYRYENGVVPIPTDVFVRWAGYLGYDVQLVIRNGNGRVT